MSREWSYSGRIDRKCQHFWECPPPLRPKRAAQTAAQDFAPAHTPKKQQIKRKRDTSNEVRKGTFLKRFDIRAAGQVDAQPVIVYHGRVNYQGHDNYHGPGSHMPGHYLNSPVDN